MKLEGGRATFQGLIERPQMLEKGEILDAQQQILQTKPSGQIDSRMGMAHPHKLPELAEHLEELEIDSFTMSKALEKRNALTQVWKDNYDAQQNNQNNVQNANTQQNQGTQTNPNTKPSDPNFAGGKPSTGIPEMGEVPNWDVLSEEIMRFLEMLGTGNLEEGMDYLLSRRTVLSSRLEDAFMGLPHHTEQKQMKQVFSKGREKLEDGYIGRLQDSLRLSDADTKLIKTSLRGMVSEREQTYEKAWSQIKNSPAMTRGAESKSELYLSAQLRGVVERAGDQLQSKGFTFGDLRHAGELANGYQMIYNNAKGMQPRQLASDLASVDLKMRTMIDAGKISKRMANILQNTKQQCHERAMDLADERAWMRKELAQSDMADRPRTGIDRGLVKTIYDAIIHAFERNGGDLLSALREGASAEKQESSMVQHEKHDKKRATLYQIDGRAASGINRAIVYFHQSGQVRDYILGGAAIAGFLGLLFFLQ